MSSLQANEEAELASHHGKHMIAARPKYPSYAIAQVDALLDPLNADGNQSSNNYSITQEARVFALCYLTKFTLSETADQLKVRFGIPQALEAIKDFPLFLRRNGRMQERLHDATKYSSYPFLASALSQREFVDEEKAFIVYRASRSFSRDDTAAACREHLGKHYFPLGISEVLRRCRRDQTKLRIIKEIAQIYPWYQAPPPENTPTEPTDLQLVDKTTITEEQKAHWALHRHYGARTFEYFWEELEHTTEFKRTETGERSTKQFHQRLSTVNGLAEQWVQRARVYPWWREDTRRPEESSKAQDRLKSQIEARQRIAAKKLEVERFISMPQEDIPHAAREQLIMLGDCRPASTSSISVSYNEAQNVLPSSNNTSIAPDPGSRLANTSNNNVKPKGPKPGYPPAVTSENPLRSASTSAPTGGASAIRSIPGSERTMRPQRPVADNVVQPKIPPMAFAPDYHTQGKGIGLSSRVRAEPQDAWAQDASLRPSIVGAAVGQAGGIGPDPTSRLRAEATSYSDQLRPVAGRSAVDRLPAAAGLTQPRLESNPFEQGHSDLAASGQGSSRTNRAANAAISSHLTRNQGEQVMQAQFHPMVPVDINQAIALSPYEIVQARYAVTPQSYTGFQANDAPRAQKRSPAPQLSSRGPMGFPVLEGTKMTMQRYASENNPPTSAARFQSPAPPLSPWADQYVARAAPVVPQRRPQTPERVRRPSESTSLTPSFGSVAVSSPSPSRPTQAQPPTAKIKPTVRQRRMSENRTLQVHKWRGQGNPEIIDLTTSAADGSDMGSQRSASPRRDGFQQRMGRESDRGRERW